MVKDTIKRVISAILLTNIFTTSVSAYTPGPVSYSVDLTEIAQSNKVIIENGNITISGGGRVTLDIFIPFNACEMVVTYEASSFTGLSAEHGGESKTNWFFGGTGTSVFDFTDDVCKMGNGSLTLSSASGDVTITDITFNKVDSWYPELVDRDILYSDYDAAMQTAAVFKEGINVFKDMGGIKYLSYKNPASELKNINGVLYAPAEALASAFDLYLEDYQDKSFVFFRDAENTKELALKNSSEVVYENGVTYLSIKEIADYFGIYTFEREGYLITDPYKLRGKAITQNDTIFTALKNEMSEFIEASVAGNVYHVSASAGSGGDGSAESPFKTITEAANIAKAGDKVIIHEGKYRETVTPQNSGTAKNPIVFEAAEGESVTVSAFEEISGFKPYEKGMYVALLPQKLDFGTNMILFNDKELAEGRSPNVHNAANAVKYPDAIESPLWPTKGAVTSTKYAGFAESEDAFLNGAENNLRGATYVTHRGAGWNLSYGEVVHSVKGMVSLKDLSQLIYFGLSRSYDWGYITNSIKTVDESGEWYANNGALYIIPPEGVSGEKLKVEAKQRYVTFDLDGKSGIHIRNINTSGGNMIITGDLNIVDGGTHKYVSHFTYPNDAEGNKFAGSKKSGMYITGRNNAFINSRVEISAASGFILGGRYAKLCGNYISDCDYSGSGNAGVSISAKNPQNDAGGGGHEIMFNTVRNTGRACIGQSSAVYNGETLPMIASEIAYNEFYNANLLARDSGVFYENGVSGGNDIRKTEHHHNVYHDSLYEEGDVYPNAGLYHDNNTGNSKTHHNVFYYTDGKSAFRVVKGVSESIYIQKKSIFPTSYSVVEAYDNKDLEYIPDGFDSENPENFMDAKLFNYGAESINSPCLYNYTSN